MVALDVKIIAESSENTKKKKKNFKKNHKKTQKTKNKKKYIDLTTVSLKSPLT